MPPDIPPAVERARAILGLGPGAPLAAWRPAFSLAIRKVHPDLGGDPAQARAVLDAYRLLKAWETDRNQPPRTCEPNTRHAHFEIAIAEAFHGVRRDVMLEFGQPFRVCLPPGLRSGDQVEFGQAGVGPWRVAIATEPDREICGSDLWLRVPIATTLLRRGGAAAIETPRGLQPLHIPRATPAGSVFDLGLPALPAQRGHPCGAIYVQVTAARDHIKRQMRS